jgi:pyridoxal phosphate enzyme (YggS family)
VNKRSKDAASERGDDIAREVRSNLEKVRARIARACERARRDPASVTLVAVSKTKPFESIGAALEAGQRDFGENYAQELQEKADAFAQMAALGSAAGFASFDAGPRWHFLGALQTNKAKVVVGRAALVHTVDRPSLAAALGKRAAALGLVQRVLLEVNLADEPQKGGVAPADLPALLQAVRALPALRCEGLMCIPPAGEDARPHFARLRALRDQHGAGPELSMGMSDDFEAAIEEGATLVRVGTAIFGARAKAKPIG